MEQHGTEAALLPNIANQMRSLLSNLYLAASQVIPPEQREQDPALDAKAAILEQSFFRLLRLVNSMSAAEYLSDSQTLSLRDADLVKFAKATPDGEQNEADYLKAFYFVEETKLVVEEEEPEQPDPMQNQNA